MLRAAFRTFTLALAVLLVPKRAAADTPSCAPGWEATVYAAARASVVRIHDGNGFGAGFFWKSPKRVVTAMHVVAHDPHPSLILADGTRLPAHLVAGDDTNDVAILELDGDAPDVPLLLLGDPASLPIGSPVIVIGHPLALESNDPREAGLLVWSMTHGVLSARNDHQIQTDTGVTHGHSGGPVLDCDGRVVGIVSHGTDQVNFATAPRDLLTLDREPRLPTRSFRPTSRALNVGWGFRASHYLAYGPLLEFDSVFFERIHLAARATVLFGTQTSIDGDRAITSRQGLHAYAGAGYAFRIWRADLVPQVGAAFFGYTENALTLANGAATDSSRGRQSVRLAPGIALPGRRLGLDYKLEIDFGRASDSAHLLSLWVSL
jgi:hypothetical protein